MKEMKSGRIYKIYRLYQNALARRPFLVNAIQTGTLMGVGDCISQTVIEKNSVQNVDFNRLIRFASIGFFMCGPVLRLWFGVLHKHVGIHKSSKSSTTAIKKVFLDQVIFAPIYLYILLVAVGFSRGKSLEQVKKDMEIKFLDVLQLNYLIWPTVQLVNFYFTPIEYQVLVGSTVALCWDTYLSWKINRPAKDI